jgi:methionyl-tRNA formyltransferase
MKREIVYFGTAEFAVPALQAIHSRVSLVVCQPDAPARRGQRLQALPVKLAAHELGLPVETPVKSRAPEFVERLRAENATLLVVAAYGQILSQAVLDSAKFGGINLHGSILPKYRGAAPIQRAILDREAETGVTLMQMDKGMDTGDMIALARHPIGPDSTYGELSSELSQIAADMLSDWIERLLAGNYPREPQNHDLATHAAKTSRADAELSVSESAEQAYARFRAVTPSPGAFLATVNGHLKLSAARLGTESGEPGTLVAPGTLAFASGSLELIEVQPEGKKRMSGRDLMNGWRLRTGDRLVNQTP